MINMETCGALIDPETGQTDEEHFNEVQDKIANMKTYPPASVRIRYEAKPWHPVGFDYPLVGRFANEIADRGLKIVLCVPIRIWKPDGSIGRVESRDEVKAMLEKITADWGLDRDKVWRLSANEPNGPGGIADGKGYMPDQYLQVVNWYLEEFEWPADKYFHNPPWDALSWFAGRDVQTAWQCMFDDGWAPELDAHVYRRWHVTDRKQDLEYERVLRWRIEVMKDIVAQSRTTGKILKIGEANVWPINGINNITNPPMRRLLWCPDGLMMLVSLMEMCYALTGEFDFHQVLSTFEWGLWMRNENEPWRENPIVTWAEHGWSAFRDVWGTINAATCLREDTPETNEPESGEGTNAIPE